MLGGGRMATVQVPFSNTRCRQMVSKILIFWKLVLPWLCLISAFQTPTSYKWNDTCPFALYAVNRVLRFGFWQSEFGFQIVKVPVFRHNNLLQNPTYCKIQPTLPYSKLSSCNSGTASRNRNRSQGGKLTVMPRAKNGLFGPKPEILGPKKTHFLIETMFRPRPEKVVQRKKLPLPK